MLARKRERTWKADPTGRSIAMAPKGKVKRRAPVGFNQVEGKQEDGIQ